MFRVIIRLLMIFQLLIAPAAFAEECRLKLYVMEDFGEHPGLPATRIIRASDGLHQVGPLEAPVFSGLIEPRAHENLFVRSLRFVGPCQGAEAFLFPNREYAGPGLRLSHDTNPDGIRRLDEGVFKLSEMSVLVDFEMRPEAR